MDETNPYSFALAIAQAGQSPGRYHIFQIIAAFRMPAVGEMILARVYDESDEHGQPRYYYEQRPVLAIGTIVIPKEHLPLYAMQKGFLEHESVLVACAVVGSPSE